jgi:hypothetical protein
MVRPAFDLPLAAALFLAVFMMPVASLACDPIIDPNAPDLAVTTGPDCRFSNGGIDDTVSGAAVVDIGGGKIGQKLEINLYCGTAEELMFVDCTRGEVVTLAGGYSGSEGGVSNSSIALIQAPQGPISLRPSTTVAGLAALAESNGIAYSLSTLANLAAQKQTNQFDPFCGCKIFYPDSAGANK